MILSIGEALIDLIPENDFGLVLANIQKNILLLTSEKIKAKLKKNGIVVLSGLLLKDEKEIISHYKSIGFKFIEKKVMNDWIAIVFEME